MPTRKFLGLGLSVGLAAALRLLLHRSLALADVHPDFFLLGVSRDFGYADWSMIAAAVGACAFAIVKRRPRALVAIQAWTLASGLFLSQLALGTTPGEKVDPRLVYGLIAGIATLHGCYVCLVAHVVVLLRRT